MKKFFTDLLRRSYGVDEFSKHLYYLGIGFYIIGMLLKAKIFNYFGLFLMITSMIRSFSSKHSARYQELNMYKKYLNRFKTKLKVLKLNVKNFKTDKYVICKNCNQQLRVPRKQGKIVVSCPRCHNKFNVRT